MSSMINALISRSAPPVLGSVWNVRALRETVPLAVERSTGGPHVLASFNSRLERFRAPTRKSDAPESRIQGPRAA
eukprot:15948472-Heterocapsa_arctica.AAC.1